MGLYSGGLIIRGLSVNDIWGGGVFLGEHIIYRNFMVYEVAHYFVLIFT